VDVGRGKRDAVELTVGLIPRRDFRRSYMRSPRAMRQGIPLVAVLGQPKERSTSYTIVCGNETVG
jgi:hypothetical protein